MTTESVTKTIAVGFDGSPQGRDALALGADLARVTDARVAVVVVYPVDLLVDLGLDDTLQSDAEAMLAKAPPKLLDGLDVEVRAAISRSDARGLHDTAEKLGANILVVGSSHRGAVGRVLPGSVGTRLLHGAPCAVAVAPSGYAASEGREIRVVAAGYDGSPESGAAVVEAAGLAAAANGTLRIVAVAGTPSVGSAVAISWSTFDYALADQKAFLEKELDSLAAELPPELRADARVRTGNPAIVLREEAAKGVDLLVVGSRGYGAIRRVMLGSVSAELLRSAPCPVLVIPRGAHERDHAAAAETTESVAPA